MRKLVKVCGMTSGKNIREVEALGVDIMGFIFHPRSPRFLPSRPDYLPASCKRAGVFVDASREAVLGRVENFGLDLVQLHGSESPSYCRDLLSVLPGGVGLVKVFHVGSAADVEETSLYEGLCRFFLFDTACPEGGGSGRSFDWSVMESYRGGTPFLLSGGIGPGSVAALKAFSHPLLAGYDLNSKFETAPGLKDAEKIGIFLEQFDNEQDK